MKGPASIDHPPIENTLSLSVNFCCTGLFAQGLPRFQKGITIYAREGHTFAVIAGLLLDTKPWDNSSNRWAPAGKPRIVCHADSKQTIRLGCDALLS
jgi:hypothetical protein